ncbi:hypothetical protein [Owenweeksia hongkongensis]|uniref:hypothetical protein n=1 Tax=Owenweeksia hongkongensis TaxID=253245 RepID=UPI003A94AF9D
MELTLSLCTNCDYNTQCTLRNGHAVHTCDEHFASTVESQIKTFHEPELKHFKGLCGNCELKDDCHWRNDDIITFHCEHYL